MTRLLKKYTNLIITSTIAMLGMIFILSITEDFFTNILFLFLFTFSMFAFFIYEKDTKRSFKYILVAADFLYIYAILLFENFYVSIYILCFIFPLFFVMQKDVKVTSSAIWTNVFLFIASNFYILLNSHKHPEFSLFLETNFFMNLTLFVILNIAYLRVFKQKFLSDAMLSKQINSNHKEIENLKYHSISKSFYSKNSSDTIFKLKFYLNNQKQISRDLSETNEKIRRYTLENQRNSKAARILLNGFEDILKRNIKELSKQSVLFLELQKELANEENTEKDDINKLENINVLNHITSEAINDAVNSVSNIQLSVENIKNISNQINLLSLNASIESSKLGETGKSFTIISKEIKHLQENISELINTINSDIQSIQRSYTHSKENLNIIIKDTEFLMSEHRNFNKDLLNKGELIETISTSQVKITSDLDSMTESFSELSKSSSNKGADIITLLEENEIQYKLTLRSIDATYDSLEILDSNLKNISK